MCSIVTFSFFLKLDTYNVEPFTNCVWGYHIGYQYVFKEVFNKKLNGYLKKIVKILQFNNDFK